MAEEQEEVQEDIEEKEKPIPFWQRVHPIILVGALVLILLAVKSAKLSEGDGSTYIFLIILIGIIIFMMSKTDETKSTPLKPHVAEHLVIQDTGRKQRWGQFDSMSTFDYSVVNNLQHKDGRGLHYNIGVTEINPYKKTEYYLAKVIADGKRKGFVTYTKGIGEFTGRDIQDIKDLVNFPEFLRKAENHPILKEMWGR